LNPVFFSPVFFLDGEAPVFQPHRESILCLPFFFLSVPCGCVVERWVVWVGCGGGWWVVWVGGAIPPSPKELPFVSFFPRLSAFLFLLLGIWFILPPSRPSVFFFTCFCSSSDFSFLDLIVSFFDFHFLSALSSKPPPCTTPFSRLKLPLGLFDTTPFP